MPRNSHTQVPSQYLKAVAAKAAAAAKAKVGVAIKAASVAVRERFEHFAD